MKKNIEIVPNIQKLFGIRDENLQVMESGLNVSIDLKSNSVQLEGAARDVARAEQIFTDFDHLGSTGQEFTDADLSSMLRVVVADGTATLRGLAEAGKQRSFGKRQPHHPCAACGGSRRTPGLSAGDFARESRSLFASAI
jgi:phosphate starvation-inducible PhoH-like protein